MDGDTKTSHALRVALKTHGCRLNQAETNHLKERLERDGHRVVPFEDEADAAIINTCTVTREAEAKCRKTIRGFMRRNPDAFTAVIGCYSQTGAKALAGIEGVDLIIGNHDKSSVLDHIALGKNAEPLILRERIDASDFTVSYVGDLPSDLRANLKIQDGCDFMCSFCIIPFARGRARSREFADSLAEARTLADSGVRELVLTGVNIGTYGSEGHDFVNLVDALDAIPGIARIRVSSIEPTTIPVDLLHRMAEPGHKLLPYLHIPLQAGTDKVLKLMRRKYTLTEFLEFIQLADKLVPDLCIGTDILVGHPGESAEDFDATCQTFLDHPFAYCHVFPYSERPGTLAARRDGHVPKEERNRRSAVLRRLSGRKRQAYYRSFLGREVEVLFENSRDGHWTGYTPNYIKVRCESTRDLRNKRVIVKLEKIAADFVEGRVGEVLD